MIDRNGGYFITRLAANANPRIVAIHRQWRGRAIDLEGKRLKEVASRLQREVLDVEVEVAFQRRVYAGTRRTVRRRVRLVAVRLPESTEYRFYLTNIDPDSLDAQCVAQTYAARWQIELIFKELKSHYRLDELPTSKAHIVETLLLGAVITLLVSRRLLQAVRERLRCTAYKMPEQRWAALFAGAATTILDIVVLPARVSRALPGASNRCCFMRRLTQIGRADSSSSASNPAPLGLDSMYFNPLTDHQCGTAARGIGRKSQVPSIFPGLTIGQNVDIALWANRLRPVEHLSMTPYRWRTTLLERLEGRFAFLRDAGQRAGSLSVGERQMLDFALTMLAEPDLVLLDEPCAGLSVDETVRMTEAIAELTAEIGATGIIIEHDMQVVERLADHVLVLHQGRLLASGTMDEVRSDPAVQAVYAGGSKG